jgi:XTP/dITP diphosphohydrolase
VGAGDLGVPEPEETGSTFAGNAAIKATAVAAAAGLPALSDDSGLEVERLDGQPGIYSARWAGPDRDFALAMERIERELRARGCSGLGDRRANFSCALCLAWPDGAHEVFEGRVFGHLVWPPRGTRGFGYDPMFVADGETLTFGEMEPARKHAISHRARAFAKFAAACLGPARGRG